jgi:hypothetical protein
LELARPAIYKNSVLLNDNYNVGAPYIINTKENMNTDVEEHLINRLKEIKKYDAGSAQMHVSIGIDIAITIIEEEIQKKKETIISEG